jgi:hypothetical protein
MNIAKQLDEAAAGAAPREAQCLVKLAAVLANYNARPRKRTVVLPAKEDPASDCVLELSGAWPNRLGRPPGSPVQSMARRESRDVQGAYFKFHAHF